MESPVNSSQSERKQLKKHFARAISRISSNWAIFLFLLSVLSAFIGWVVFGISPLRPLKEIAYRQEQEEIKNRMVKRHFELANLYINI